jgi:16S rRNA (adenine1518-N6/adenine1519-N6)-dimethyltransferase
MNHIPRKRFGQNFLHDPNIINRIVSAIQPKTDQNILEIGPGKGAITFPVLDRCKKMTAIELDRDLIKILTAQYPAHGELNLISADALTVDFSDFGDQLRVIGNLPYNISSPLLFHLLEYRQHIQDMHFMLQKEVVDRMAANPGSKTFGRLSVMIQTYCQVSKIINVPPGAFNPPPAVDSAIVRLTPIADKDITAHDRSKLAKLVSLAFSQRRKTLRNNFRGLIEPEQMQGIDISPTERAENLHIEQFIALSKLLPST